MFQFESPLAFLLLLFAPVFLDRALWKLIFSAFFRNSSLEERDTIAFSSPVLLSHLPSSKRHRLSQILLPICFLGAYILLVIALARPQYGTQFTETEASGRDIMLVLDTSGSMKAVDFVLDDEQVTRLEALKHVVKQFIDDRQGDRMGLVVFGTEAFTQCPLTLDHGVLKGFVDSLQIGMAGEGTAIGGALAIALKRTRDIESDSKVVVLVTDGKNNPGTLDPMQAAEVAKQLNVKIHTIGIGSKGPAPFREKTIFGFERTIKRYLEFDEKVLTTIAEMTGGNYFNAKNTEKLADVYKAIDALEEREDKVFEYVQYQEKFFPFALLGFLLLLLGQVLVSTVFLKVP